MENLAIFVHSGKGGVGKSTFAKGLVDYYRSRNISTAAYDCDTGDDTGTESLYTTYGERTPDGKLKPVQDPLVGVVPFSIRDERERDWLVNLISTTEAPRRVIDLPGGAGNEIREVLGNAERLFAAYRNAGIRPIVAIVIDHIKASAASVTQTIKTFGPIPHYIIIKNLGKADDTDFEIFDGYTENGTKKYGKARDIVEKHHGEITTLPKLERLTYARVDNLGLSWDEAARSPLLKPADHIRVTEWRLDFAAAVEQTQLAIPTSLVPA